MLFDLDAEEGEWFQFFGSHIDLNTGEVVYDEPTSDARVRIRPMAPFIEARLAKLKKTVEHVYNTKSRVMERISYYPDQKPEDAQKDKEDAFDYIVIDWENIKNSKTSEVIPCTRENKLALMKNPVFDRFVARCQQLLSETGIKKEEIEEKN
jgi:hypothetical protein